MGCGQRGIKMVPPCITKALFGHHRRKHLAVKIFFFLGGGEIIRQNTGRTLNAYIAAATKQKVPDIAVIHMAESELDAALKRFADFLPTVDAIKSGVIPADSCGECDYCLSNKVLTEVIESDSILL